MKIGQVINDKWIIDGEKGGGGQGAIYIVRCKEFPQKKFALKNLKQQNSPDRRARMNREVNNVATLSNEHLMKIIDSNIEDYLDLSKKLFYISDYIEGETLEDYINNVDVKFEDALAFFNSFLNVMEYCHSKNILHRDIKPDNILLRHNCLDDFVIIDFGLSFNLDVDENVTVTNQQLGNRFLLLPELVSGDKSEKHCIESDITQACAIFFYVLTGLVPNALFDGNGKKPHKRPKAIDVLSQKITDPLVRNNIDTIFDKAFQNNIKERYHSEHDLITDLDNLKINKVNMLGENIMLEEIATINMEMAKPINTYKYSELIRKLNPSTELCNPAGLTLPLVTNVSELVQYGIALPIPVRNKVVKYYREGDFVTAANAVWDRAINLLRKRILSLGEEFVADMVESDDLDYVRNLPAYRVIDLAHDLGFIDQSGRRKLQSANEQYNFFNNTDSEAYEEMPQDEANIIIKNCIRYILCTTDDYFGLQFNDFREKLKTGAITELYDDDKAMFATCPYFYLKTTVRSLLKLFRDTEGIEFDNVTRNMKTVFPIIWERLKIEERRALADAYTDYSESDNVREQIIKGVMLQVRGFDYVKENVRSRTYIQAAKTLIDIHFGMQNYYNEPRAIKDLEDLGTVIPKLALKECVTAILFVKLGNQYGTSWRAEEIADRMLSNLTEEDWIIYLENYMVDESNLLDGIERSIKMRNKWKEVVKTYNLKQLNIIAPRAKHLIIE